MAVCGMHALCAPSYNEISIKYTQRLRLFALTLTQRQGLDGMSERRADEATEEENQIQLRK